MALTETDRIKRVDQIMDAIDAAFTARLAVENIEQRVAAYQNDEGPEVSGEEILDADAAMEEAKAELRRVLLYAVR